MTQELVLVTGATGTVGRAVVDQLERLGATTVAAARKPERFAGPVPCRKLDFTDQATFAASLVDVRSIFLMRPPAISDTKRYIRPFIRAAENQGVQYIIFLSVLGCNPALPHWRVEQDLRNSKMGWTILRPSFFAQNLATPYGVEIAQHDRIRLASGRGRSSFVDARDVAAAAAKILCSHQTHAGRLYTVTGPSAMDYFQVASLLSAELGRPIDYEPIGLVRYRRELVRQGLPRAYVNVQLAINLVARLGLAARTTDSLGEILGRPATTLATYIRDHRAVWLSDDQPRAPGSLGSADRGDFRSTAS